MKKIFAIMAIWVIGSSCLYAQKEKSVTEREVDVNYVKDFQNQVKGASNITWNKISDDTFKVYYTTAEACQQAMIFSNRGTETHYFIDKQYIPSAVKDTVSHLFGDFTIDKVWVRKMRGKMTYQARIVKTKGILWWKKETDRKMLNFEVDGKYINAE